jgi:hypothetical protein
MAKLLVQRPCYAFVQRLDGSVCLLGNVAHDGVHKLSLVVALLALDNIFRRHSAF